MHAVECRLGNHLVTLASPWNLVRLICCCNNSGLRAEPYPASVTPPSIVSPHRQPDCGPYNVCSPVRYLQLGISLMSGLTTLGKAKKNKANKPRKYVLSEASRSIITYATVCYHYATYKITNVVWSVLWIIWILFKYLDSTWIPGYSIFYESR